MADDKKWFKVWTKILTDPDFDLMPLEDWGRWLKLGAFVALQGNDGIFACNELFLRKHLQIENLDSMKLPNILIDNCNGNVTVSFKNWSKYQSFSESYERVKKWREKKKDNPVTVTVSNVTTPLPDKIRLDKIRIEKKRNIVPRDLCSEIVSYLNEKSGKNFKSSSKDIIRLISGRYHDGFTIEDFKKVIDLKCEQWKNDPKMDLYLRPKTLFSTDKFESYLNERGNGNGKATREDWENRIDDSVSKAREVYARSKNPASKKISTPHSGNDRLESGDF